MKKRGHTFWYWSGGKRSTCGFPWGICTHCGLVLLKNEATQKLVKRGCFGAEHEDEDLLRKTR